MGQKTPNGAPVIGGVDKSWGKVEWGCHLVHIPGQL